VGCEQLAWFGSRPDSSVSINPNKTIKSIGHHLKRCAKDHFQGNAVKGQPEFFGYDSPPINQSGQAEPGSHAWRRMPLGKSVHKSAISRLAQRVKDK